MATESNIGAVAAPSGGAGGGAGAAAAPAPSACPSAFRLLIHSAAAIVTVGGGSDGKAGQEMSKVGLWFMLSHQHSKLVCVTDAWTGCCCRQSQLDVVAGPASVLVDGNGLVSAVLNSKEMDSHIEELTKAGTLTSIDTTVDATGQCVFPGLSSSCYTRVGRTLVMLHC